MNKPNAHAGIGGNACVDVLHKGARNLNQPSIEDANTVAKRKICNQCFKKLTIPELNCPRNVSSIVTGLRTQGYLKKVWKYLHIIPDLTPSAEIVRKPDYH
ncbi:hypothetical protein TNCV_860571 [Trichonephila clavipes]|nr:hypothetical protein TNCV_860571 [Trichonephila clavipes]